MRDALRSAPAGVPFTTFGSGSFAASRTVGATSITWRNCERISPLALIPLGQCSTMPLRVPPKLAGDLLGPGERCVARQGPAGGDSGEGHRAAELIDMVQQCPGRFRARR